jgi:hypothetical protein
MPPKKILSDLKREVKTLQALAKAGAPKTKAGPKAKAKSVPAKAPVAAPPPQEEGPPEPVAAPPKPVDVPQEGTCKVGNLESAATPDPMASVIHLPAPLDYEPIKLLDEMPNGGQISYTDCMESSCLRFMQAMCCDAKSLDELGRPTRVDFDLVRKRVPDVQVRKFFHAHPEILPADEYAPGRRGYETREAWARLVTHRPFFTYKRSACGVYKNEWLEGEKMGSFRWATEMEPCVHNVISLCRNFLGVTFAKEDLEKPMWNRRCDTNHEALNHDVSGDAQPHLSAAMHQLSRPGFMELQARVQPPRGTYQIRGNINTGTHHYDTDITFYVNGLGAWTWRLRRKVMSVPPEVFKELGGDGNEKGSKWGRIRTSWHSEIKAL